MSETATNATPGTDDKGKTTDSATTGQQPSTGQQPGQGKSDEQSFTQAELDAAVKKALKDAAKTAADKDKEKSLTEAEQVKARAERAETELRTLRAKDALIEAASTAKASNPAKIYRLYANELDFSDDGKPTNIAALIAQARKDFPEEFGQGKSKGSADGGAGGNSSTPAGESMNDIIRHKAGY